MRFLVDACAGQRLANWLVDQGHDVLFADQLGADPGDRALLELAVAEGRVVVTIDMDFGELVFLHDVPHAGLVRLPDVPMGERVALLKEVLSRCGDAISRRAVVTASRQRIRITMQSGGVGAAMLRQSLGEPND